MKKKYPRDMIGYGSKKIKVKWPRDAKLALQFVLNYEEGGESNTLHGDRYSENFLSEIIGAKPIRGRNLNMESIYEYGSRRGFWRIHDLFKQKKIPLTIFGVGMALERNKEICEAIKKAKHEIASHGWRWIDYQNISKMKEKKDMKLAGEAIKKAKHEIASHGWRWIDYQNISKMKEKKDMKLAVNSIKKIFGNRPLGWYTGRCSPNTLDLVIEEGGFLYCSDTYSDDLPYWIKKGNKKQLMIPYTLDNNDMRFATNQGFNSGDQFFSYLKDSFDALYVEGKNSPKMMSVGLHCRLIGRPGRIQSLKKFLNYVLGFKDVWICKRIDIAKHWIKNYK